MHERKTICTVILMLNVLFVVLFPVPEMYNNFVAAQKSQEEVSNDWKYIIEDDENKRVYIIWECF